MEYIQKRTLFFYIQKDEITPCVTTQMKQEVITLSEASQEREHEIISYVEY